jgi:hypothetical protein
MKYDKYYFSSEVAKVHNGAFLTDLYDAKEFC